jgi:hypothetical protein
VPASNPLLEARTLERSRMILIAAALKLKPPIVQGLSA